MCRNRNSQFLPSDGQNEVQELDFKKYSDYHFERLFESPTLSKRLQGLDQSTGLQVRPAGGGCRVRLPAQGQ